jgi:hypothetical protein
MFNFLIHNIYVRGLFGIVAIVDVVFFVQMIRNRKPGASMYAACFKLNSLTEKGMRAKRWTDVLGPVVIFWIVLSGIALGALGTAW